MTIRLLVVGVVWVGAVTLIPFPLWQGIAVVAAVVSAVIPPTLAAWAAAACLPFGVILTEPSPGRTALALLLVHAVHVLASISLVVPMRSRLALRVLRPTLLRFVVVQLLSQPLVFAMWLLAPRGVDDGTAWFAPIAAAVLVAGVLLALWAARRADAEPTRTDPEGAEPGVGADVRGPS
ncbi:hypothetical protein ACFC14_16415 [Microbacterium sp. NPDC055988]|uniref:hypothetical protein n=1 Tax=Microbacterium sp. NPDC055988 TaxID=3345671 RepID=UPI0035DEB84C